MSATHWTTRHTITLQQDQDGRWGCRVLTFRSDGSDCLRSWTPSAPTREEALALAVDELRHGALHAEGG